MAQRKVTKKRAKKTAGSNHGDASNLGFEATLRAAAVGRSVGGSYTAQCVAKLIAEMIWPYKGRVLDPCCGYKDTIFRTFRRSLR